MNYKNEDRKCECWKCERSYQNGGDCPYYEKFQRHPSDLVRAGLGLCPKLPENVKRAPVLPESSVAQGLLEEE